MTALDFSRARIQELITHHVGNKVNDEGIHLSDELSAFPPETETFLLQYFLSPLREELFYAFTHAVKLDMNEVFTLVTRIFNDHSDFINDSKRLAKMLYEYTAHPKIKSGELNVVYLTEVMLDNKKVDALGLYKSETNVPFLKMKNRRGKYDIDHEMGFEIKSVDKGCLIFNTQPETGFKVLTIDNSSKSSEAQYWKDDFLKLRPIANEFHQTHQFLAITKNFVTQQLDEDFEVSKADKIDLLNRSVAYFKAHDTFDKSEFEQQVLQDATIIKSFQNFDHQYRTDHDIELKDSFDISALAVKKQARVFKSVLKLDKNFHIYIHGNRELIEQGVEKDGRKYYKIYFDQES
ncbi:MAG: nucleoid-associated protein [Chitinophagales bacterium]